MKIACDTLDNCIDLDREKVSVIMIASSRLLGRVIQSFAQLEQGLQPIEGFYLKSDEMILPAGKHLLMLSDMFHIDLNSRKLITCLHKQVEKAILQDPILLRNYSETMGAALQLLDNVLLGINIDTQRLSGEDITGLCKWLDVRLPDVGSEPLILQLEKYMDVVAEWFPAQVLVLPTVSAFLSGEELEDLFRYAMYTKVSLLLLEKWEDIPLRKHEQRWTITEDFDDSLMIPC